MASRKNDIGEHNIFMEKIFTGELHLAIFFLLSLITRETYKIHLRWSANEFPMRVEIGPTWFVTNGPCGETCENPLPVTGLRLTRFVSCLYRASFRTWEWEEGAEERISWLCESSFP